MTLIELVLSAAATQEEPEFFMFAWGNPDGGRLGITESSGEIQSWTFIDSGGSDFGHAIRSDGTLWGWGENNVGQIGDGTITRRFSPVQIGTSSWTAVSGNGSTVAAIRSDGRLFVWGRNADGQLGDLSRIDTSSPISVGTSSWTAVSSGNFYMLAIRSDGALFSWGSNVNGRLGLGDVTNRSSPVQVGTSSWTAVQAGGGTSMAIRSDGGLFTWGLNSSGQLGQGNITDRSSPVQVGSSSWTAIAGNSNTRAAIRTDGALFIWGDASNSRLGDGGVDGNRSSPVQLGSDSWVAVSISDSHAAAIRLLGGLYTWGIDGNVGRLGLGENVNRSSPVQIGTGLWTKISAGNLKTHGILSDGTLYGWGRNTSTQTTLGIGTSYTQFSPERIGNNIINPLFPVSSPVAARPGPWLTLSEGTGHVLAIRKDGLLFAWGYDDFGCIGNSRNNPYNVTSPIQIGTSSWTQVAAGLHSSMAIRSDGRLFTWGRNDCYQLHEGLSTVHRSSPVQIGLSSWIYVNAGKSSDVLGLTTYAIRSDNATLAAGFNDSLGNLGRGSRSTGDIYGLSPSPGYPQNISLASASMGNFKKIQKSITWGGMALGTDNNIYFWGNNSSLNNGSTIWRSAPINVQSGGIWKDISFVAVHILATKNDNTLWAWGEGGNGRLGDNSQTTKTTPTQIGTSAWKYISAGDDQSFAIRSDGALFAWGNAGNFTLGDGTTTNKSSPVQIGTGRSWIFVESNFDRGFAITG